MKSQKKPQISRAPNDGWEVKRLWWPTFIGGRLTWLKEVLVKEEVKELGMGDRYVTTTYRLFENV